LIYLYGAHDARLAGVLRLDRTETRDGRFDVAGGTLTKEIKAYVRRVLAIE